jgi:hypothetical protein
MQQRIMNSKSLILNPVLERWNKLSCSCCNSELTNGWSYAFMSIIWLWQGSHVSWVLLIFPSIFQCMLVSFGQIPDSRYHFGIIVYSLIPDTGLICPNQTCYWKPLYILTMCLISLHISRIFVLTGVLWMFVHSGSPLQATRACWFRIIWWCMSCSGSRVSASCCAQGEILISSSKWVWDQDNEMCAMSFPEEIIYLATSLPSRIWGLAVRWRLCWPHWSCHVQQRVPDVFFCQMLAKRVLREVCIMRRLIHPYIISCKPSCWEEYTLEIVVDSFGYFS